MKTTTLTMPRAKPRNPFVAASLRRKAGAHRAGGGARRQRGRAALRREIDGLAVTPALERSP